MRAGGRGRETAWWMAVHAVIELGYATGEEHTFGHCRRKGINHDINRLPLPPQNRKIEK